MPTYAVLGATGNTGSALIENLLTNPSNTIHAYCRNKSKLLRAFPHLADNKNVHVFEGSITDLSLIHACVRNTRAVFLTVTTNDNVPGCRLSQESAQTVLDALQKVRTEEPDVALPKLVLLSSATIDPHLCRRMPKIFVPIMKTAASNVYADLIRTEKILRANEDWIKTVYIKPGGLSVDVQRGHKLDFDEQESFISYLDLAAAMLEAADDEGGLYEGRNVASPAQLQTAYDDDLPTQRAMPPFDMGIVKCMADKDYFEAQIGKIDQYSDGWKTIVNEYVFSRSAIAEKILPLMYDGAYHSIIHLGLGAEFNQPGFIAEALAQAAAHDSFGTDTFFLSSESKASEDIAAGGSKEGKTLVSLLDDIRNTPALIEAGRVPGLIGTMKMKKSVLVKAGEEIISIASKFRVTPETLERKTAEVLNLCAYLAGAAQRDGYARKIDFFFMHCVTSSIFFSVLIRQDWISLGDKVRLVEWKGRLDLMWFVVCGVPDLDIGAVSGYIGEKTGDMSWEELFIAVNEQHDDGHVAKFVRALKNGEEVCREFEGHDDFMVKGDMWLKIARMSYDTTIDTTMQTRWVVMAGMESAWGWVPKVDA
ncbi:uncharacterized protein BDV14DRAFT_211329 [Aspergillus stella-maris]|uniref:uncharacterized protein n=1 Tax=Aspergillus stella-maris TaxID=1810926 RepID=UPI003CCCF3DD